MTKLDPFEEKILAAYENGDLKFALPSRGELAKFKAAATATPIKDGRVEKRPRSEKSAT